MCGVRANALDRDGCFSDKQERACVRLTRLSDEIYLEIKHALARSLYVTSRSALHLLDRAAETSDDCVHDSPVSCFEPRLDDHCRCVPPLQFSLFTQLCCCCCCCSGTIVTADELSIKRIRTDRKFRSSKSSV